MERLNKQYNKRLGMVGEQAAVDWLKSFGYRILHRNYKIGRMEMDIVAARNGILYCIEVKTRTNDFFGWPEDHLSLLKIGQMKIIADTLLNKYQEYVEAQSFILSVQIKKDQVEFFFQELE